jgi:hypothetical protein
LPAPLPEFGEGFDLKAREPQLAVLFLLASAFRQIQEDLSTAASSLQPGLVDYVLALASAFIDAIHMQQDPADALLSWDSFAARQRAKKAPQKVQELFATGRKTIEGMLQTGFDPRRYLGEVNERARAAVEALATRIGLPGQPPIELAPITISWKPITISEQGQFIWPSTGGRAIAWVFQYHRSALWAAVLAEIILQHEYLSHLLPQSDSLSETIREGWLMEALQVEIRERGERSDLIVFAYVRDNLNGLPRDQRLAWVAAGIEAVRKDLFWNLTRDILAELPGHIPQGRADAVLSFLLGFTDTDERRKFLEKPHLTGLDSLYEEVAKVRG